MRKKLLFVFIIVILCGSIAACSSKKAVEHISLDELSQLIESSQECMVFCTQDTCSGCSETLTVLSSLPSLPCELFVFDIDQQGGKEYLYEYGLLQVPAIIKISDSQTTIYKGSFQKEEIIDITETDYIEALRFDSIVETTYQEIWGNTNRPTDFFVYFGKDSCSDCIEFDNILNQYILNNPQAGVLYIDLADLKQTDEQLYNTVISRHQINWVPLVLHIKNGIEIGFYEYPSIMYRGSDFKRNNDAISDFYEWMDNELKLP